MASVIEEHAEHVVPRLEEGGVDGEVGVATGWALEVDVPSVGVKPE